MPAGVMVACGYKVDMPYLCEFLNRGDVSNFFAVLKLEFWYHDLPPQQRASFPCPCRYERADGVEEEPVSFLRTRIEVLRQVSQVDERLVEIDSDIEECKNFIEAITTL